MNASRSNQENSAIGGNSPLEQVIDQHRYLTEASWFHQTCGPTVLALGTHMIRYGLAFVILWIGLMKFTEYEAVGIQPLVASSPLTGWLYNILSVREFSSGLGIMEIAIAALIALRPWFPRASAAGSAAAVLMFLTTLSFLFSAPGWEPSLGGFPAVSASVGQFLLKDVVLLGAAIWTFGEALFCGNLYGAFKCDLNRGTRGQQGPVMEAKGYGTKRGRGGCLKSQWTNAWG